MSESNERKTQRSDSPRKRASLWQLAFLLLGGGLLGGAFFSQNFTSYLLFYLQPAHWAPWYSAVLWLLTIGFCGLFRYRWGRRGIEAAILATFFFYSDYFAPVRGAFRFWGIVLWRLSYERFYIPYVYAPWIEFQVTGRFSLRLLALLLVGLGGLALLFIWKRRVKSHMKEEEQ